MVDQILAKLDQKTPFLCLLDQLTTIQKILKDGDDSFGHTTNILSNTSEMFGLRRQFRETYGPRQKASSNNLVGVRPFLSVITRTTGSRGRDPTRDSYVVS